MKELAVGDVVAIPLGRERFGYGWILDSPTIAYFDTQGTHPNRELDALTEMPIAFRVWTWPPTRKWVRIGNRSPQRELRGPQRFVNFDDIAERAFATRGGIGDEEEISIAEAGTLEPAAVWSNTQVEDRLRDHFDGIPNKWLESLRHPRWLRPTGLPRTTESKTNQRPSKQSSKRVWLAPMLKGAYHPKPLVAKGQRLLAGLWRAMQVAAPRSRALRLLRATTLSFNRLAKEFEKADSEVETVAREAIAADIAFILKSSGVNITLEEATSGREW